MQESLVISVIIPVYNAEKHLKRCLQSVLAQTFVQFELLLVDNNSNDSSLEICRQYAALDRRVRYMSEAMQGASCARNCGIENATGKYLTFLDSDDYIESDYLAELYHSIMDNDTDISVVGYILHDGENDKHGRVAFEIETGMYDLHESKTIAYLLIKNQLNYVWGKLIRSSIVKENDIYFDKTLRHAEDTEFMARLIPFCRTMSLTGTYKYHYIKYGHGTLSSTYYDKSFDNEMLVCDALTLMTQKLELYSDEVKRALGLRYVQTVRSNVNNVYKNKRIHRRKKVLLIQQMICRENFREHYMRLPDTDKNYYLNLMYQGKARKLIAAYGSANRLEKLLQWKNQAVVFIRGKKDT